MPVDDILTEYVTIYRTPSGEPEDIVDDLESLPSHDDDNRPIHIFDEDGNIIPRFREQPVGNAAQAAIFIALDRIHQMFADPLIPMDEERHYIHSNSVDKYPIAHLPNVRCIQTHQPLPLFTSVVSRINQEVGAIIPPEQGDDFGYTDVDNKGFILPARTAHRSPLYATHTQVYNLSTHHFAPCANEFHVLHGQVTAAASGFFASRSSE